MSNHTSSGVFLFPRWANYVVPLVLFSAVAGAPYMVLLVGLGAAPSTTDIGYQPEQPIPYSHELHVNQLGLDCRYCHTTVEKAAFAAIPPAATCMACHHAVHNDSKKLETLYASFRSDMPVKWKKIHDLPDYAYFNHSAHISKGVSCVSCHGRVDRMDGGFNRVYQHEELSMGWCLSCHRDPAPHLRPRDQVTNLGWGFSLTADQAEQLSRDYGLAGLKAGDALTDEQKRTIGEKVHADLRIRNPRQMADCSICHR